jgi:hypothetical protein
VCACVGVRLCFPLSVQMEDFLSLLDTHVFLVLLACVCVCLCHGVHRQTNRHGAEISDIVPVRAHTCRDHSHTVELRWWRVWRWFALAPQTHIHTQTHKYACLFFVCLLLWVYVTAGCLTLIRSRSSCNHTYQRVYLCVCVCIFVLFLFVLSEYTLQLVA